PASHAFSNSFVAIRSVITAISGADARSRSSVGTRVRTSAWTFASDRGVSSGASKSIAWHAPRTSIAATSRASETDVAAWDDGGGQQIGGNGDRRAVEVAARHDVAAVGEHHRVVGRAVGLDLHGLAHEAQRLACGAVHLGRAAQRVRILDLAAVLVRLVDAA